MKYPEPGDYVLATKYSDGDPGDHFCVGYLREIYDHFGTKRYVVVDGDGKPFRANGFRRCRRVSVDKGNFLVKNMAKIESGSRSVWSWWRHGEGKAESGKE